MMRYVLITLMFAFSLILPGTVFHFLSWSGVKPDLLMLLTIYMAIHHRRPASLLWGVGAGLLEDLYFGRYIGMYALTLFIVAFAANWLTQRWYRDNFILTTFMVFLVTSLGQICVVFLSLGAGLQWSIGDILQMIFGVALYNSILVPITYPLIHRSFQHGWLRYRPRYER